MGGSVRGLEYYNLGNGEIIVNVTEVDDTSEVRTQLGEQWTWESTETRIQPAEEGEGATEWLVLIGAKRLAISQAA